MQTGCVVVEMPDACPGHGFYERQPDAMLPDWKAVTEEDIDMHDYAVQHQLLKDIPDLVSFKEDPRQHKLWSST